MPAFSRQTAVWHGGKAVVAVYAGRKAEITSM
jgi:hypothetical protein